MLGRVGAQKWVGGLLQPGSTLSQRVMRAGFWAFAIRLTGRFATTIRTIILARLLAPTDFGLMGIALLMMRLLEVLTRTGFKQALIQRADDINPYLNTAWTIELIRGALMAMGLFFAAPLIAAFFNNPNATPVLQVMALSIFIDATTNISVIHLQKELEFHKQFVYTLAQMIPSVVVGIGLALWLQNVWALVYGTLAASVCRSVTSYIIMPRKPGLSLDLGKAKELYGFGKWVFGSGVLVFFLNHLDDIIVGRVLDTVALGLYRMGYTLSQLATTEVTMVIGQVLFPAYAKLQDSAEKLREGYLRTLHFVSFFSFPMSVGIFVLAEGITRVVLGANWLPMVTVLQLLVGWGLIRSFSATTGSLFQGVGRPDLMVKLQFAKILVLGSLIYPFTAKWGIEGAASAVMTSALLVDGMAIYKVKQLLGESSRNLFPVFFYPAFNSVVVMGAALVAVQWLIGDGYGIGGLVLLIGVGALAYLGAAMACQRMLGYTAGGILKKGILRQWLSH